ncbi:B12-binding domain-containing radical SAM protein [Spirochaetia bacterium]|nr:B12-binding domain-containing radical SAM protein [Spirochaetia bacterium]
MITPVSLSAEILLTTINAKWIHPSLALRLLKANLGELENRCDILEFALRQPLAEKVDPILAAAPRILGISVSIWNHKAALELLKALNNRWNGKGGIDKPVIILGGPEVSYLPVESEIFTFADWVVRGEGELVFRELCRLLLDNTAWVKAAGISDSFTNNRFAEIGKVQGKFIDARPVDLTAKTSAKASIDAIDPGYRLYTAEDLTRKLVYVEASRGCPFGCEFCQSAIHTGVREFPLDSFLGEMEKLIERGARGFKFLDRTFNLDIKRARTIMEFFLEKIAADASSPAIPNMTPVNPAAAIPTAATSGPAAPTAAIGSNAVDLAEAGQARRPLYVHFEMVPARFPTELREILTRFPAGSLRLELGIQTFNSNTAALINRPSSPEKELETLKFLRQKTKAIVHADLIAGLPGEDMASFGKGFDLLWQARPTEIQLGILKLLPGTPIARHTAACGMIYAPEPPYEVMETAALPAADLDRIKNFARFWELIVNRGVFPDLVPTLFPEGQPVFSRFLALSDTLLGRFGRNWGIDRSELRGAVEEWGRGHAVC